tara:strand:+ start:202 stop:540 length:339 start_codon:yes stop_codon:yes gene_type:complete
MKTKKRKRPVISLENRDDLVEKILATLAVHSGYSAERIKNDGDHHTVGWRRIAMYILSIHFDWTMRSVAEVFNQSTASVYSSLKKVESVLNSEDQQHLIRPFLDKVLKDLEL